MKAVIELAHRKVRRRPHKGRVLKEIKLESPTEQDWQLMQTLFPEQVQWLVSHSAKLFRFSPIIAHYEIPTAELNRVRVPLATYAGGDLKKYVELRFTSLTPIAETISDGQSKPK